MRPLKLFSSLLFSGVGVLLASASQVPLQHVEAPFARIHYKTAGNDRIAGIDPEGEKSYQFRWPVKRVAIVGAGPSGLIGYRELSQAGFEVHVFERDNVPGGNWHYTDEVPVDAPIPNVDVSVGDFVPSFPPEGEKLPYEEVYDDSELDSSYRQRRRVHRGPKPLWKSLKSNAPAPSQQKLPHEVLQRYLRSFASYQGLNSNDENPNVHYNTRVEHVAKRYDDKGAEAGWSVIVKEFGREGPTRSKATWREEHFDAVVVATGRWNAPYIPVIPGVKEWSDRFPGRVFHSRQYRHPNNFVNETILIVGAATSGGEISRDLLPYAKKIYQSIRPDNATVPHFSLSLFLRRLPSNVTVVGEIKEIEARGPTFQDGKVVLGNGTVLTGIDRVIFATGFRYSFPFLPAYHNSSYGPNQEASRSPSIIQPIVTDGTHLRSLHLDLFYIPEPTLAFLDMNIGMQTFNYAVYLSAALAKVWAGKAHLPNTEELWRSYDAKVKERGGYGRHFLYLGVDRTNAAISYFIGWLNSAAVKYGGRQLDSVPPDAEQSSRIWAQARWGSVTLETPGNDTFTALGLNPDFGFADPVGEMALDPSALADFVYSDWW